jgi:hypothetical protein
LICSDLLAGYSEDSDYTSDLNYPVGGQNPNSSASQYRNLKTPQRSLETSRENSYEKDERFYYDNSNNYSSYNHIDNQNMSLNTYSPNYDDPYHPKGPGRAGVGSEFESDPLFYNSRPMK